ncbi:MAG: Na/Pi cotransporter family protein, partial [Erysipelotrichaceae bacterium]|nr:Na/Pi cotransporter family protein [Erysipelotrichaceae bacterium]
PIKGLLLGTAVTGVIQSSSATTVMVVGFVNSGMMKVRQAIGIILGAILGTSITGWILCLNSLNTGSSGLLSLLSTEVLTGIVAFIGIGLWMFAKKSSLKNIGGILLGFSVLMYGMSMMSAAISPLRSNEQFIKMLTSFANPVLGVLAGLVLTAVIQSASAAVGILQALAMTGAITFNMAFPILMGIGIGASVPVMLSALGASANGKRTAFVYLVIDILGAVLCGIIFYSLNAVFHFEIMGRIMTMVSIALTNTLYRLVTVILLTPLIPVLEKIVVLLFPESEEAVNEKADMDRLESRFLEHPTLSLAQSRTVIDNMARKTMKSVIEAVSLRRNFDEELLKKLFAREEMLDRYEDKIGAYLSKVTASDLNRNQSMEVSEYLKVISEFERISDHARNVGEAARTIEEKKLTFSDEANRELNVLEDAVSEVMQLTIDAFLDIDTLKAIKVEPLEELIDDLCDQIKSHHIERVQRKECTLENGFVLNDMLTDYERMSDHCSNIALDVLELKNKKMYDHQYVNNLLSKQDEIFKHNYAEYKKKYSL